MNTPLCVDMDDLCLYATCPKWYYLSKSPGLTSINEQWKAPLNFKRDLFRLVLAQEEEDNTEKKRTKFHLEVRRLYASYFYKLTPQGLSLSDEIRISHVISCFRNLIARFKKFDFTIGKPLTLPYNTGVDERLELRLEPIAIFSNTPNHVIYVFVTDDVEWCLTSLGRRFEHAVVPFMHEVVEDKAKVEVFYVNPSSLDLCKVKYNKKIEPSRLDRTLRDLASGYAGKSYIGGLCQKCPYGNECRPWEQVEVFERLGKITI